MTDPQDNRFRRWLFLPVGVFCIAFVAAAYFRPPAGDIGPDPLRFIGRLHMLALHLPIGLLLTLPILEIMGLFPRFKALKQTTTWILGLGTLGAMVAAVMGYLLATTDGYASSELLTTHMWGGVIVACLSTLAFSAKIQNGAVWSKVYAVPLVGIMVVLPLAAHEGGSLTHGVNYLTQFSKLKEAPKTQPADQSLFVREVQAIFNTHCIACHGAQKAKGDLRLDSFEAMIKSNKGILDPAQSELIRRITLPADDEEAMPPGGKNPLAAKDIEAIKEWVKAGSGM